MLAWQRNTGSGDYVSGKYRIRRFKAGMRGSGVVWILTYNGDRIHNQYVDRGYWPTMKAAKVRAEEHAAEVERIRQGGLP